MARSVSSEDDPPLRSCSDTAPVPTVVREGARVRVGEAGATQVLMHQPPRWNVRGMCCGGVPRAYGSALPLGAPAGIPRLVVDRGSTMFRGVSVESEATFVKQNLILVHRCGLRLAVRAPEHR